VRKRWVFSGAATVVALGLFLNNSSSLTARPNGIPGILAHRGVHQTFSTEGLTRDTCTAARINPPTNQYIENTKSSITASFAVGATALEIDVHPTTDGEFAVFHDWGLECRTNGKGVTREQSISYLKSLDLGYGYTADGGQTYPFRGKGVGLMPTLAEVLKSYPSHRFLINIKSNDSSEADRLVAYLAKIGVKADGDLWIFADGEPRLRLAQIAPKARVIGKKDLKTCSMAYLVLGWSGAVPGSCRGKFIAIPTNLAPMFWGWPNRLIKRVEEADVEIMLVGPVGRGGGIGVDDPADLSAVPEGFHGVIMTDNIEIIGPAVRRLSR
jgi:glycerophosphoryl diester phosphodiesterase